MPPDTRTRLEVIVTAVEEAREAEAGGADCLEIVSELRLGGLTPDLLVVEQILAAVSIPARVMLRRSPSPEVHDRDEVEQLLHDAKALAALPIDGLVLGFIENGNVNVEVLSQISRIASTVPFTFHRAFEELAHPLAAIETLKQFGQVDRILVSVAGLERDIGVADLRRWQAASSPAIEFIAGIGLSWELLEEVIADPSLKYVHVGRFAREGHSISAPVSRAQVAKLRRAVESALA